ncbi:MAG: myo-inositol-1 [Beijerinckiaceae bacterium]|nr:MAG: myo-inositol-1 [Beijerinckiaceae bacterium]
MTAPASHHPATLTPADIAARFQAVQGMVLELGRVAMGYFENHESLGISMKGAQDWLTIADGKVEALFRAQIAEAFPGDAVMGEEAGGSAADRLWIIDPIDGTANFARGDRMWCVSIGFVLNGRPEIGIIHAPALGETYLACRGKGATMNGKRIEVARTNDIARSSIEYGWSPRRSLEAYLGPVRKLFEMGSAVKRGASGAMGLAHVAIGRTDAYAEAHINAWDVAAGLVIAAEAGAVLNDFCSGNWLVDGNPVLVATPGIALHVFDAAGIAFPSPAKD